MIRVIHYIGTLELGGSQSFVMELYRNIDRKQVQFDFVVFEGWRGSLYDEINALGGRIYESPKYNGLNHILYVRWWEQFLSAHREYKVLHGHVRSVALLYLPIAKKHGLFTIIHSHSAANGGGIKGLTKAILQLPIRYLADYYLACSEVAGRWLFGNKVVNSKRYRTVTNAINIERFKYRSEVREKIRKEYGISDCFVIGHVGRFYGVKNQAFLLDLLKEFLKINKNSCLLLIGDGPDKGNIEHKCNDMDLSDHVIFTGSRTDTEEFYQAMDVFVFPSKWEGFGIVAIEAQTSGLPCIVSEGVPQAVDIGADLVHRLKLDAGAEKWAGAIGRIDTSNRKCRLEEARKAGYDIRNQVAKMQRFYINIHESVGIQKNRTEN